MVTRRYANESAVILRSDNVSTVESQTKRGFLAQIENGDVDDWHVISNRTAAQHLLELVKTDLEIRNG